VKDHDKCFPRHSRGTSGCPPVKAETLFDGTFVFDGRCLFHEPGLVPPDGVYGRFVVADGKVTEFLPEEIPTYTPPPCVPEPEPCGEGGEGAEVSPLAGNLTKKDTDGTLLTRLYTSSTDSVTLSGNGTAGSPLRAVAAGSVPGGGGGGGGGSIISATPDVLPVQGNTISHATSAGGGQILNSIEFDAYGHAIGASSAPGFEGVKAVEVEDAAIKKEENNGVVLLTLPMKFNNPPEIQAGDTVLDVDIYGRVTGFRQGTGDAANDRISEVIEGNWRDLTVEFDTHTAGKIRVGYWGDLTLNLGGGFAGFAPTPAGVIVKLDGTVMRAFLKYTGTYVQGFEAVTNGTVQAGAHSLTVTITATGIVPTSYPGLVDIWVCRP
jgi:hypothetical protein